jgi:hypothetical protein
MAPWAGHTVAIGIEQIDAEKTAKDPSRPGEVALQDGDEWGKTAAPAVKTIVTVLGQFRRYDEARAVPGMGGDIPAARGHAIFMKDALAAAGLTLANGDKIVSVAGAAVEFYVIDMVPTVTYGGESLAMKAVYADRPKGR